MGVNYRKPDGHDQSRGNFHFFVNMQRHRSAFSPTCDNKIIASGLKLNLVGFLAKNRSDVWKQNGFKKGNLKNPPSLVVILWLVAARPGRKGTIGPRCPPSSARQGCYQHTLLAMRFWVNPSKRGPRIHKPNTQDNMYQQKTLQEMTISFGDRFLREARISRPCHEYADG